mgnify:CR=1 FL=1
MVKTGKLKEGAVTVLIVLSVVLIDLVVDVVFLAWWLRRLRAEAVERMREITKGETVYHVEDCNFFGRLSSGYRQWRGNGLLALTDGGLCFRQLLPRKELFIPLDAVTGISRPRSFLGKTRMKDLVRVDFRDEEGKDDACAWLLPSTSWWIAALEALRAGEEPPAAPWKDRS